MLGISYVYKWTHLPTFNWYVGVRTSKRGYPGDSYICSALKLKEIIEKNPTEWIKTIIAIGNADDMLLLEQEILTTFNAAKDPRSYNKHNSDHKFSRTGISWNGARAGENNPNYGKSPSKKTREKQRRVMTGKSRPDILGKKKPAHAEKMRTLMTGRILSPETKAKISASRKGKKYVKH